MPNWVKVLVASLGMVGAGALVVASGPAGPLTAVLIAKAVAAAAAAGAGNVAMLYHDKPEKK